MLAYISHTTTNQLIGITNDVTFQTAVVHHRKWGLREMEVLIVDPDALSQLEYPSSLYRLTGLLGERESAGAQTPLTASALGQVPLTPQASVPATTMPAAGQATDQPESWEFVGPKGSSKAKSLPSPSRSAAGNSQESWPQCSSSLSISLCSRVELILLFSVHQAYSRGQWVSLRR